MTTLPTHILAHSGLKQGKSLALKLASQAPKLSNVTPGSKQLIILEGGPGNLTAPDDIVLIQLPPGCPCCVGQLILNVTLTRAIRQWQPQRLWIEIASTEHLPAVRKHLTQGNFAELLSLENIFDSIDNP